MMKNKVLVKINGSEYTIIGEEAEDHLFLISRYLDRKIKETLSVNPKHSNTSAAVLTALMITDELFKFRKENTELKKVISEPEEKLKALSNEIEELKILNITLSNEYETFKQNTAEEKVDTGVLQNAYNEIYENYIKKNEEYDNLINEAIKLEELNTALDKELQETKLHMRELKDELLESEIEHVKLNKELKNLREAHGKRNNS
jgi:cell division protein ZapA